MRVVIHQMRPDGWKGKGKTSKAFKLGGETLAIRNSWKAFRDGSK